MGIRREPYQRKPTGKGPIKDIEKVQWSIVMVVAFGTIGYAMYSELAGNPPPPPPPAKAAPDKHHPPAAATAKGGSVSQAELDQLRESIQKSAAVRRDANGQEKAPVNATVRRPPIVQAAITCDPGELKTLLDQGQEIDAVDSSGETALIWAVKRGCVESVRLLLSRGADVNIVSSAGVSALALARKNQNLEVNRLLEDWGARTSPTPAPPG